MADQDPYSQIAQPMVKTGATASGAPAPKLYAEGQSNLPNGGQVSTIDPYDAISQDQAEAASERQARGQSFEKGLLKSIPPEAGQMALGAGKGLASTATALPAYLASKIAPNSPKLDEREKLYAPSNTAQSLGRGIEQAGEFMVPGLGEEKAAALLPEKLAPLGRIGYQALTGGGVNALQGGDFKTGALAGAGTGLLGEGMRAAAPGIAEKALGMRGTDRAFGKTPGRAILDETSGVRPETVAASAKERIGQLTPELESKVDAIQTPSASLVPARAVLNDAGSKAISQNAPGLYGQINNMENTLHSRFTAGQVIPPDVTPRDLLNLKRGFSEEHLGWNPDRRDAALSAGRRAYGALDSELDRAVPEAAGLNQRISSLIPTVRRGEAMARGEGATPRIMERVARSTGALVGPVGGAMMGYQHGGATGAAEGAGLGLILPELLSSPTGRMIAARSFNRSLPQYILPAIRGGALQLDRDGTSAADTMVTPNPKGLIEAGNLPIWNRPTVQNEDGTHSSEYSVSFADDKGREVLVPTIVNGKFLTPDGTKPPEGSDAEKAMFKAAWQNYLKTGHNLGKFDTPDDADAYAQVLHNRGSRGNK